MDKKDNDVDPIILEYAKDWNGQSVRWDSVDYSPGDVEEIVKRVRADEQKKRNYVLKQEFNGRVIDVSDNVVKFDFDFDGIPEIREYHLSDIAFIKKPEKHDRVHGVWTLEFPSERRTFS